MLLGDRQRWAVERRAGQVASIAAASQSLGSKSKSINEDPAEGWSGLFVEGAGLQGPRLREHTHKTAVETQDKVLCRGALGLGRSVKPHGSGAAAVVVVVMQNGELWGGLLVRSGADGPGSLAF